MVIKKRYTRKQAEQGLAFMLFLLKRGNEAYVRAFYEWMEPKILKAASRKGSKREDIENVDIEKLMIEYCIQGLQLSQSFNKSKFSDEEIKMLYSKYF